MTRHKPKRRRNGSRKSPSSDAALPTPIIRWNAVDRVIDALAEHVAAKGQLGATAETRLKELLKPYELLDNLHRLAQRVRASSAQARIELCRRLCELERFWPDLGHLGRAFDEHGKHDQSCGCDAVSPDQFSSVSPLLVFDEYKLLIGCVLNLAERGAAPDVVRFTRILHALVAEGSMLERMHEAWTLRGARGLAEEAAWFGLWDDLSGFRNLRGPRDFPWRPSGQQSFLRPWLDTRALRCAFAIDRLIAARGSEPPRPQRVLWWDNITSVTSDDPCGWAENPSPIVIRGLAFGANQPPNVGLMLIIKGTCTPFHTVPFLTWSDDKITFRPPDYMTSGAVAFVDLDYVKAYDAWVDALNHAVNDLVSFGCGSRAPWLLREHFHECPGSTASNSIVLGDAFILSFEVNGEAHCTVDPEDAIVFSWNTLNATDVRLRRISATGPLLNGQADIVGLPAQGTFVIPPPGHAVAEQWEYQLFAVGPCNAAARSARVTATKHPRLLIHKVEVTQGIQTSTQSVRLVQHKPTVVRVTVRHQLDGWGNNEVAGVTARLRVLGQGWKSLWVDAANGSLPMAPNPGTSIVVVGDPQEQNTNDTLNFRVPTSLCEGTRRFEIEVRVAGFAAVGDFPGVSETISQVSYSTVFVPRRRIRVRYSRVKYGNSRAPTDVEARRTLTNAMLLLPTPGATLLPKQTDELDWSDSISLNTHLCREDVVQFFSDLFGDDEPAADELRNFWVYVLMRTGGEALSAPGRTCWTSTNSTTAAHELAHLLGHLHLEAHFCNLNDQPHFAESADTHPLEGRLGGVAFDIARNSTVRGTAEAADLMTYCSHRWTSAHRWDRLWNQIG